MNIGTLSNVTEYNVKMGCSVSGEWFLESVHESDIETGELTMTLWARSAR